jgi:hypothetical protein
MISHRRSRFATEATGSVRWLRRLGFADGLNVGGVFALDSSFEGKGPMQTDYHLLNAQAAEAAQWMHEELQRNKGTLTLDAAWKGVHGLFGDTFAREGQDGQWLARPILTAFRKVTPNVIWDSAGKQWLDKSRPAVNGLRMQ